MKGGMDKLKGVGSAVAGAASAAGGAVGEGFKKLKKKMSRSVGPFIFRIGLEIEGCILVEEGLNFEKMGMGFSPILKSPYFYANCEDILKTIETEYFEKESESLSCGLNREQSVDHYQFNFDNDSCSIEFILKKKNKYFVSFDESNSVNVLVKEGPDIKRSKGEKVHDTDDSRYNEIEQISEGFEADLNNLFTNLKPDLSEKITEPINGLRLHYHVSDETPDSRGPDFLSAEGLKTCMIMCLLWYGSSGLYEHSVVQYLLENGIQDEYYYFVEKTERVFGNLVENVKSMAEINSDEFVRIFNSLDDKDEGSIEECIRYLLVTMYPNNLKAMPLNIYNLTEILEPYRNFYVQEFKGPLEIERMESSHAPYTYLYRQKDVEEWKFYNKNLVEFYETLLSSDDDIFHKYRYKIGVKKGSAIKDVIKYYGNKPLRIEFRYCRFHPESCYEDFKRYSYGLMAFFNYTKEISLSWNPGEALLRPQSIIPGLRPNTRVIQTEESASEWWNSINNPPELEPEPEPETVPAPASD